MWRSTGMAGLVNVVWRGSCASSSRRGFSRGRQPKWLVVAKLTGSVSLNRHCQDSAEDDVGVNRESVAKPLNLASTDFF